MTKPRKTLIIFLLVVFLTLVLIDFGLAQAQQCEGLRLLEVPFEGLTCVPLLPEYIEKIFRFSLTIIGFIVFGALIYGGFRYLTSAGNPAAVNEAKDQIFSAFLGLIILLSAYLILNTINPELVVLGQPGLEELGGAGVIGIAYEGVEFTGPYFVLTVVNKDDLGTWDNRISSIRLFPTAEGYVITIYENPSSGGGSFTLMTEEYKNLSEIPLGAGNWNDQISSIQVVPAKVTVYNCTDFATGFQEVTVGPLTLKIPCQKCPIVKSGDIPTLCGPGWDPNNVISSIKSIKINNPAYSLVLHESGPMIPPCTDVATCQGMCQLIKTNMPKLTEPIFGHVQAVTLIEKGGGGKATLYDLKYYNVYSRDGILRYTPGGHAEFSSDHSDFSQIECRNCLYGNFDNAASSLVLEKNVLAILFEEPSYQGSCNIFSQDVPDLGKELGKAPMTWKIVPLGIPPVIVDLWWDDKSSSIQIVNGVIVPR